MDSQRDESPPWFNSQMDTQRDDYDSPEWGSPQLPTLRDKSPEWDKTTASIASLSSDDLHESRPNRWRGPKSTWRGLTQNDRSVHTALEKLRNGDLAVHLYNAFALKGKRRVIGDKGELVSYNPTSGSSG